jgi:cell wall-associated NlpC family hydrolase
LYYSNSFLRLSKKFSPGEETRPMIIKRFPFFITIAVLILFPVSLFAAPTKSVSKKKTTSAAAKSAQPLNTSSTKEIANKKTVPVKAQNKTKKSLRAQKKRTQQIARENHVVPLDKAPLLKVTPLENGKFLLEPMDSSLLNREKGTESLSLIKKPVFEEEMKLENAKEEKKTNFLSFPTLLVEVSKQLLGKAYRLGGNGQGSDGIDCSGYMKKVYQAFTLSLPHSSREQAKLGSLVTTDLDLSRLRIGDLLFFKRGRGAQIGHTGMYIGEGQMIHSSSKKGVIITNLENSDYYHRNFVMAKRLFILDRPDVDEFKEFKNP